MGNSWLPPMGRYVVNLKERYRRPGGTT